MPLYNDLAVKNLQTELIRKSLGGSVFVAEASVEPIGTLTSATSGVSLAELPVGYGDLGYLTDDGAAFSTDTTSSDITSWQSTSPTRSDITAETTTLTVTAQETKLLTLGLYTGIVTAALEAAADTGEVQIKKPERPSSRFYRVLSLAVDEDEDGEIYIARFLPRAKVTGKGEQSYSKSDNAIQYPITFQGYFDSEYGASESFLFGGAGWLAKLEAMGIEQAT